MKQLILGSLLLLSFSSFAGVVNPPQIHDAVPPREGYVPTGSETKDSAPDANDECEAAYKKSIDSGVVADALEAADICKAAVDKACEGSGKKNGDARLVAAVCRLKAAHGAYLKVK